MFFWILFVVSHLCGVLFGGFQALVNSISAPSAFVGWWPGHCWAYLHQSRCRYTGSIVYIGVATSPENVNSWQAGTKVARGQFFGLENIPKTKTMNSNESLF